MDKIADIEAAVLNGKQHLNLIFSEISNQKLSKSGEFTSGDCPKCNKKGKLQISMSRPFVHCYSSSCELSTAVNWQTYSGRDFESLYRELASAVGIEWASSPEAKKRHEQRKGRAAVIEAAFERCRLGWSGSEAERYALGRGYSREDCQNMRLGAYPGAAVLKEHLFFQGYTEQEIASAGVVAKRWESWPLLMLWRDKAGMAVAFQGRTLSADKQPKYLYSEGMPKDKMLYGYEQSRRKDTLTLLESPLAASYLNSLDIKAAGGFVALGGTNLSREQLEMIKAAKAKRLYLALDMDKAGQKDTAKLIEQLSGVRKIEELFIVGWHEAESGSGFDDYAMANGETAVSQAISDAGRLGSWLAYYDLAYYDTSEPGEELSDTEQEQLFSVSKSRYLRLQEGADRVNLREYGEMITARLGWSFEEWYSRVEVSIKEKEQLKKQALAERMSKEAAELIGMGDTAGGASLLRKAGEALRQQEPAKIPEPKLFTDLLSEIKERPEALELGYEASHGLVNIPVGAYSVISAKSGHGKTTFMLNLLSNWLDRPEYSGKNFYFYGYEETEQDTMIKLLMLWSGEKIADQNFMAFESYLKQWPEPVTKRPEIEKAITKYKRLTEGGRLILSAERLSAPELADTIQLLGKSGKTGAVIVDYIQLIPLGETKNSRQLELQEVTQHLRSASSEAGIAVLTGAQLNKKGDMREAMDILQEAALVMKLENKSFKAAAEGEQGIKLPAAEYQALSIKIEKQRKGRANQSFSLELKGATGKISDLKGIGNDKKEQPAQGGMSL